MRDTATDPRGFTLLELMIIVAIIGVLAAIVIPNWASTSRNKKYDPEVSAMFAEISTKEEQYKSELGNGAYLAAAECPAAPTPSGANWNTSCNTAAGFSSLRVNATDSTIFCAYEVHVGCAGSSCTTATTPSYSNFTAAPTTLVGSWYYLIATCDMDANSATTNATFFISSWATQIQKYNYGQ